METLTKILTKKGVQILNKEDKSDNRKDEVKGLRKLFIGELKEIYWAEGALRKVLQKMHKHASSFEIIDELSRQLDLVKDHQLNIEEIFSLINEKAVAVTSRFMKGLIVEVELLMDETKKGVVRDAGIISYALKMKHFEIAAYSTLCFYSRTLGDESATASLRTSLDQENMANEKISQLIESISLELVDTNSGNPAINMAEELAIV